MTTTVMIPAKGSYTPPTPPADYQPGWMRTQLSNIARALLNPSVRSVTHATTITASDNGGLVKVDATSAPVTVTLLPPSQVQFLVVTIKRMNSGANAVTIGGTVDGTASPTLGSQYAALTIMSDGTTWNAIGKV